MGVLLILRTFFGGLFTKILSDWRIILAIILVVVGSIVLYRIHKIESNLAKAKEELVLERKNNDTLRGNVSVLVSTNKSNGVVIEQVTKDKDIAITSITKLSASIANTNKSVSDLKTRIDELKTPPTPLTPYLSEVVDGIQKLRDEANPIPKEGK